jgi:hypothetical protein
LQEPREDILPKRSLLIINSKWSKEMKKTILGRLLLTSLASTLIFTASGCSIIGQGILQDQGYKLNGSRNLKVGDIIKSESQLKTTSCKANYSEGETEVEVDCKMSNSTATDTEVLELEGEEPSKLKRTYITDTNNFSLTANGKTEEYTENGVFHQKSILLQKTNGVWNSTLVDGKPTEAQAKLLKEEQALELDLGYPSKPVKIGESWDMGKDLRNQLGSNFLISSSSGNATLKEIVQYQGEQCALIEFTGDIKGTELDDSNNEAEMQMTLKGIAYRSLSSFTDIDSKAQGVLKLQMNQIQEGKKIKIKMTGNYQLNSRDLILRR